MSDSEPVAAEDLISEGPDASPPTTPDTATDVAPTRRAKRRPEPKPAEPEPEEPPNVEEQPAQVHVGGCNEKLKWIIGVTRKASPLTCFVCPHPSLSCRQPLCLREVGATGAAGVDRFYPQQQLLWPPWVSKEFRPESCLENGSRFLFMASVFRSRLHSGHREGRDDAGDPQPHRTICTSWARAERAG